ncbi:MAG TPA: metalloregulator ArsR/SmtB family transcription factor [Kineosporiaceae bacterium]|nr:metalloregulator ArsR/SmtB family transcription factor [Kineosporiaceae bacterium]
MKGAGRRCSAEGLAAPFAAGDPRCDLGDAFDVSGPTISHHLRVLREAGLVDCERRGTWVYYWIRPDAVRQLGALLQITTPAPA